MTLKLTLNQKINLRSNLLASRRHFPRKKSANFISWLDILRAQSPELLGVVCRIRGRSMAWCVRSPNHQGSKRGKS